jgi:hypothetical protein
MIPHQFCYLMVVLGFLWLFCMLHVAWPSPGGVTSQRPGAPEPITPRRTRSKAPPPFVGLTHKPPCALCAYEASHPTPPPPMRPDPIPPTHRRPREVDTSRHFCPHATCDYRGWVGLGNLRANGHPSGGPWRQFHCTACDGYFPEHHGTIFHVTGCKFLSVSTLGTCPIVEGKNGRPRQCHQKKAWPTRAARTMQCA